MLEDGLEPDLLQTTSAFCAAEDVIEAVVARVQDRAEAGGVELFARCGTGGVEGIRDDLVEALGNVVLNAIEMTPAGAAVFVASYETADRTQFWTVQDMGPGIPEDVMADLGRSHHSRKQGGWGLGLAATRSIVERHGGLIRVESWPGSGTLVTICFPSCGYGDVAPSIRAEQQVDTETTREGQQWPPATAATCRTR